MTRRRKPKHVSGFVSVLGLPNSGKSTLVNALVGTKVAIVSDKPQTTRQTIQGVLTTETAQVIFLDTPGIHEGGLLIHKRMMGSVREALEERDLILWVADATRGLGARERGALELVRGRKAPLLLALNKIDLVREKQRLLPLLEEYAKQAEFGGLVPISAQTGDGIPQLRQEIEKVLPAGPRYFPPDQLTDQPARFLAAELIREKALEATRQEIPHAVAVLVDTWEEKGDMLLVEATIFGERESHKKILIGSGGAMLKRIGSEARHEMESVFGRRVRLEIFVKVKPDWRGNQGFLDELDWRCMTGGTTDEDNA